MTELILPELQIDERLFRPIVFRGSTKRVLDQGFVKLVDFMGGDDRIVQAARVSYGDGTKTLREDAGLIRYLIENKHWTPIEKVVFELHFKLPIFVARQFVRHRTQSLNEVSARYSEVKDEFYIPEASRITTQDTKNRQGSTDKPIKEAQKASDMILAASTTAYDEYQKLLKMGVARELARVVLPVNVYTEWFSTMNLRNLFNFLELRLDSHAQFEARQYAKAVLELCRSVAPVAFEVWEQQQHA